MQTRWFSRRVAHANARGDAFISGGACLPLEKRTIISPRQPTELTELKRMIRLFRTVTYKQMCFGSKLVFVFGLLRCLCTISLY